MHLKIYTLQGLEPDSTSLSRSYDEYIPLLGEKFSCVDIFSLDILPDAMFLLPVAPLWMEKIKQIFPVLLP